MIHDALDALEWTCEPAPVVEVPGRGFVLGLHRNAGEQTQHPEVVRLDATAAIRWTLALPRPRAFNTYEVRA